MAEPPAAERSLAELVADTPAPEATTPEGRAVPSTADETPASEPSTVAAPHAAVYAAMHTVQPDVEPDIESFTPPSALPIPPATSASATASAPPTPIADSPAAPPRLPGIDDVLSQLQSTPWYASMEASHG